MCCLTNRRDWLFDFVLHFFEANKFLTRQPQLLTTLQLFHTVQSPQAAHAMIRRLATPTSALQPLSSYPPPLPVPIKAACVLSRSPLVLPPLSPFERHYYAYQRLIRRALGAPVLPQFWFKAGSLAERQWTERENVNRKLIEGGKAWEIQDGDLKSVEVPKTRADREGDVRSLKRRLDRSLYLLLKYKDGGWRFPTSNVRDENTLVDAALKGLEEQIGRNVDAWNVGRAPGATFFLPVRLLHGQAAISSPSVEDFAWCTPEEVKEKVGKAYWDSVGVMVEDPPTRIPTLAYISLGRVAPSATKQPLHAKGQTSSRISRYLTSLSAEEPHDRDSNRLKTFSSNITSECEYDYSKNCQSEPDLGMEALNEKPQWGPIMRSSNNRG
ncbi:hypothetical protein BT69DRAFT_1353540 [Atractiella rhizophila]|nr:hypothetical protein BT69DRAFT_1353540 [Atractiella rhizophila]